MIHDPFLKIYIYNKNEWPWALWHSVQGLETEIVLAVCWDRLINCSLNSLLVFQNIVCGDGFYLESAYLFCLWYKCLPHAVLSDFESSYVEKKPITKQKDCWTKKTESFLSNHLLGRPTYYLCQDCCCSSASKAVQTAPTKLPSHLPRRPQMEM